MSKKTALKSRVSLKILSISLTTIGIMLLIWYLRFVETGLSIWLLYAGVATLSIGNMLAFVTLESKSKNIHFILVLFLTTIFLANMYTVRFDSLQGSDILYEYTTARTTLQQGTWSLARSPFENYFSAISVSLVPALLSQISGLNLFLIFEVVLQLVAALLPIIIFITVKEVFKNTRLAGLSSLLFSQLYFNFTLLPSLMRQYVAEITLVLSMFILIRMYQKKSSKLWAWTLLLSISLFGVAAFHYTVAYWAVAIFLAIFIFESLLSFFPKKLLKIFKFSTVIKQRQIFRAEYLLLFFVFLAFWTITTNLVPFLTDVHNQIYLLSGGTPAASGQYQVGWLSGSTVGLTTTAWFIWEAGLGVLGFIYFMFKVPKQTRHVPWIIAALVMFAAVAIWISPSFSGGLIYLDRVYLIGSIFFTAFAAGLLLKINSKLKVVVIIFLLINLPVNMLIIPNQRYVLYHKESDVAPADEMLANIVRQPSMVLANWLNLHPSTNASDTIYTDSVTGPRSLYSLNYNYTIVPLSFIPTDLNETGLFFFHYLNLEYGLWQTSERTNANIDVQNTLNDTTIVYNNGQAMLAYIQQPENP